MKKINTTHFIYDERLIANTPFAHLVLYTGQETHSHLFWELTYIIKGEAQHHISGKVDTVSRGMAILCRPKKDVHWLTSTMEPNYMHRDVYISDDKFKVLCNSINENLYEELISNPNPICFYISTSHIDSLEANLSLIDSAVKTIDETGRAHYENESLIESIHRCAVMQILSYYLANKMGDVLEKPHWLIELLNNLSNKEFLLQPLEHIVQSTGYCHGHLCREFKKYLNISPKKYIQQQKLQLATQMLLGSGSDCTSIAYYLNYTSQSSFIKAFKEYFGKSPSNWKKERQRKN